MRLIGITGGIGSGKSKILEYIKEHYHCKVYLADQISHFLMKQNTECYQQLISLLGNECLDLYHEIDKSKMAQLIFKNQDLLVKVNQIMHPAVKQFVKDKIKEEKKNCEVELFFLEAALLIEEHYDEILDEMWYIHVDQELREQRLVESRGYSIEKINDIMKKQLTKEQFLNKCDFVIDNNKTLENTQQQIRERLRIYTWRE